MNKILIECENVDFVLKLIDELNASNEKITVYNIIDNSIKTINTTNYKKTLNDNNNIHNKIIQEIIYLGYDFSYTGTQYLIQTIEYIVSNPDKYLKNLEKYVYSELAKNNNTSIHNIKCNINRANNMMYVSCEVDKLKKYFGFSSDVKPKVKTVINTIINKILQ